MTLEVPLSLAVPGLRTAMRFMMHLFIGGIYLLFGHPKIYQD
jgi:hypothetical protein